MGVWKWLLLEVASELNLGGWVWTDSEREGKASAGGRGP